MRVCADEFPTPVNTELAKSQPMTPEEVAKTVALPPGFRMSVFATEPDVRNPIAMTTDCRGRLWIAENYTWSGGGRGGGFDKALRDRVVILEDTDGDGKFDKRTVFWDQATALTSIEVGFGGVWLLCSPNLLFIPDANGDDVPDGAPRVVLDGFDDKASAHTIVNGLKWGPDGWLYGRQGILGTSHVGRPGASESQRFTMNTGVWRYHPIRKTAEVVMHGMTNPWGMDFDEHGEMFVINTVIGHLWHVLPGARTQRMFGTDFNPHAYQLLSQTANHVHWNTLEAWNDIHAGVTDSTSAAGGGHAHCGLMIYQGDNWPDEYRGRVYTLNLHGRRVNSDVLKRQGSGYVATHGHDMCFVPDPWFRGMDLISGPDGGVYIADWSDTGECHENDGVHRTSGRIYKLTFGTPRNLSPFDLSKLSDLELVELQIHQNDWYTRKARRLLQERAASGTLSRDAIRERLLKIFNDDVSVVHKLRAMWALHATDAVDQAWLLKQLHHPDEHTRCWAVRFLADDAVVGRTPSEVTLTEFRQVAEHDSSGLTLLHVACALQHLPLENRWSIGRAIATREVTSLRDDEKLAIMIWLAIEPAVPQHPEQAIDLASSTTFSLIRENIARRLALEIDRDIAPVEGTLQLAANQKEIAPEIIQGIVAALHGRRSAPMPTTWAVLRNTFVVGKDARLRQNLDELGILFGDKETIAILLTTVGDRTAEPERRRQAIRTLVAARSAAIVPMLLDSLDDQAVTTESLRGLASYDDPRIPKSILDHFAKFNPEQRTAAVDTLVSRLSYARALFLEVASKHIEATNITAFQARQIGALKDDALNSQLNDLWGHIRATPEEKQTVIAKYKLQLSADRLAKADPAEGKMLFKKTCANCHALYGEGESVGPDLTGSNRKNIDYLLENIVDPSATVGAGFRAKVFVLVDGRVVTGITSEENDRTITLKTAANKLVLDRKDIEETTATDVSIMPDGLLQTVTDAQVRDLVAYLMSNAPLDSRNAGRSNTGR